MRDVEIHILFQEQAVYRFFKMLHMLNLIEKDVVHPVCLQSGYQISIQGMILGQIFVCQIFEVDGDDLVR